MLQSTRTTNVLLAVIALSLVTIAVRPYMQPAPVQAQAQTANADPLFVEPGSSLIRMPSGGQVPGKVITNLRTGNVWGFATGGGDGYPMSPVDGKPGTAHAVLLGRYELAEIGK
jgi:hypothetical protein